MAPVSVNPQWLVIRAIGFASTDKIECAKPLRNEIGRGKPLFGDNSINFHQLMVYISAACGILTIISTTFLSWRHLHRYTAPNEQRQILRIINLPIAYAFFNFLALTFTLNYLYIEPIGQIYEAFTVAALFFLVLEYVCPDGTDREKFFENLPLKDRKGNVQAGGSLKWFQRMWSGILQYPLLKTILIIIQIITQYFGDYCESSWSFKHAHLYLTIIDYLFVGGALGATIRFARRMRTEIAPIHKSRAKIWSFLGILIFQLIQNLIFHILNGKLFNPSATVTYNDINFGIASFLTCIEAIIFSLIFHWTFSSGEYKEGARPDRLGMGAAQRTSTLRAILDALNPADIIAGSVLAFQLLFMRVQSRYGGSTGVPTRQKPFGNEQMHLEPMSHDRRNNFRGYDDVASEDPYDTEYNNGYGAPQRPMAGASSPYLQSKAYDRGPSPTPESQPLTEPRQMM